jgi:hypothetical protein
MLPYYFEFRSLLLVRHFAFEVRDLLRHCQQQGLTLIDLAEKLLFYFILFSLLFRLS